MKNKFFSIDKNSQIILYGVSSFLPHIADDLFKKGFQVLGFFDKNAQLKNKIVKLPVWTYQKSPFTVEEKKHICIILCLQNCQEHGKVARQLHDYGYEKILFLPDDSGINDMQAGILRKKYNFFLQNNFQELYNIPLYASLIWKEFKVDNAVIYRSKGFLIAWVPVDLIYSYQQNAENTEYDDKNITVLEPYFALYQYFEGNINSACTYFSYLSKFHHQIFLLENGVDKGYLEKRFQLYCQYESEKNRGMDFFIESAPPAIWNKKGYFNLEDGHHRTVYLCEKGLWFIPLRISEHDFCSWCGNQVKYHEIISNITNFFSPISLPPFVFTKQAEIHKIKPIFVYVARYIQKNNWNSKSFLEISHYDGFFARHFARSSSAHVTTIFPISKLDKKKALCSLNELSVNNTIECFSGLEIENIDFNQFTTIFLSLHEFKNLEQKIVCKIWEAAKQTKELCIFWDFDFLSMSFQDLFEKLKSIMSIDCLFSRNDEKGNRINLVAFTKKL